MTTTSKICLFFRCKWVHPRFSCDVRVDQSFVFCYCLIICFSVFFLLVMVVCVLRFAFFFYINAAVSSNFHVIKKQKKQTKKQKNKKTSRLIFFVLKRNTERIVNHQPWVTTVTIINWYIKYWIYLNYLAFQYFGFERYLM